MHKIRPADEGDLNTLVDFNQRLAAETEGIQLDGDTLRGGVESLLGHPALGFYLVATVDDRVVGCLMVTQEWSDWRNGAFWWIQSVYVVQEFRRTGVFRSLYEAVQARAAEENVCGFRLYVERDNVVAQQTYSGLGMNETVYKMFEHSRPGRSVG